ncbi:lipid A biosynthesis (KDO)2-(lauroyl)-lipid IVA acyltransferase [Dongshaea marina]|uniref:lipid A biosynthesis (KDO)2-(lauroyl)-lipid IVA acyltransferase n=1 Tax=Dongshaea marina TaxID=2047966 RepID=UPI000D3E1EAD|nr:lipid A biosynthesis (KDO)2-(lauroyl)-lipid IVA acyltransferase [Dongshaea marina]
MPNHDHSFDSKFKIAYLHPRNLGAWLGIMLLFILSLLPVPVREFLAQLLAPLVVKLAKKQVRIAKQNLKYCFSNKSDSEIDALVQDCVRVGIKGMLNLGELSFRSKKYLASRFVVKGTEHLQPFAESKQPVIIMTPHTWVVDAGLWFSLNGMPCCTMVHAAHNPVYDWYLNRQRVRFGGSVFERNTGIKHVIRSIKSGNNFYYMPDQDRGAEVSEFVPFFDSTKATLTSLSKLARLTKCPVVPAFCGYNEELRKYEIRILPPFEGFPSGNDYLDALAMNQTLEQMLGRDLKQYMWFLKLFKTRPENGTNPYESPQLENPLHSPGSMDLS